MPTRPTGKQRASRIPLDYYKKPDRLTRLKLILTGLAMLAALGWWASGLRPTSANPLAESDAGIMRYSHGPLANVHATWDARCDACHVAFKPIGEDSWTNAFDIHSKQAEAKCMACHKVEDHHANQLAENSALTACATCHNDHRGRDASLVRLPDSDCTSCHADLKSHAKSSKKGEAKTEFQNVTSFANDHPEFALFASKGKAVDPGTLKFNHAVHLAKGMNLDPKGPPIFTARQLSNSDRERYAKGLKPDQGVQLDCNSCHRLESGSNAPFSTRDGSLFAKTNPLPGSGAYMQPITYEANCIACHTMDVPMKEGKDGKIPVTLSVQHGLQPPKLHEFLWNASVGITLRKDENLVDKLPPTKRALPGPAGEIEQSARKEAEARVKEAERILFGAGKGTCTECHFYTVAGSPQNTPNPKVSLESAAIYPTYVPTIWYEHANFNHSSHRAVTCKECHVSASASVTSEDVLIPSKDFCVKCHAPPSRDAAGLALGGAGYSCTECHRYHGADHKPGPSMAKDSEAMSFSRFLGGK